LSILKINSWATFTRYSPAGKRPAQGLSVQTGQQPERRLQPHDSKEERCPSIRKQRWGGALWSPSYFAVRALDPALKGEVCRATNQFKPAFMIARRGPDTLLD